MDAKEAQEQDPIPGVKLSETEPKNWGPASRWTGPESHSSERTLAAESGPGKGPLRTWPTVQLFRQGRSCDSGSCPGGKLERTWHQGPKTSEVIWPHEADVAEQEEGRPRAPQH